MAYVDTLEIQEIDWFIERIGQRVFRGDADKKGILIIDITHAQFLHEMQYVAEGRYHDAQ